MRDLGRLSDPDSLDKIELEAATFPSRNCHFVDVQPLSRLLIHDLDARKASIRELLGHQAGAIIAFGNNDEEKTEPGEGEKNDEGDNERRYVDTLRLDHFTAFPRRLWGALNVGGG